jgi:hypothetical protein
MKSFKVFLLVSFIITVLFMYLGMYNEIISHYKDNQLSSLIGFRVRHLNSNFYTGYYFMSVMILTAGYFILSAIKLVRGRVK